MTPAAQLSMLRKMWMALFPLPVLFLVAGIVGKPKQNDQHVPVPLLAVAAVVIAALGLVMPRLKMKKRLEQKTFKATDEASEAGDFRSNPERVRVLAEPEAALDVAMKAYASSMMAGMGPAIAVAMLGFSAMFFERVTWEAAPFFLASWILMALQFPRRETAIAALERASGAKYREAGGASSKSSS